MKLREAFSSIKEAVSDLFEDRGVSLAAALSYYAALSLAPLLLVLLAALGWIIDREKLGNELVNQMRALVGDAGANIASTVIQNADQAKQRGIASAISFVVLVVGASGVFVQLQDAMNIIWEVKARPRRHLWGFLRTRLISFGMLLAMSFLMLVSLAFSTGLAVASQYFSQRVPGAEVFFNIIHLVISLTLFTAVFAALFKYLPDAIISWRAVWIGAFATALLFSLGKLIIGLYLGQSSIGSVYGAAGSIIAWLIWVYYSSLILLLGAEFTQVHARRSGSGIRPSKHAESVKTTHHR